MTEPEMAYADTPVQILVVGDQDEVSEKVLTSLALEGVVTYRASDLPQHSDGFLKQRLTGVVLAMNAVVVLNKAEQKLLAQELTGTLHGLLPLLAQPAQVFVLARREPTCSQTRLDRTLASVIAKVQQEATTEHGVNLSINALDIAGSVDATLIAERVIELFDSREEVTTGQVLDYDEIEDQSIRSALALRFLY